MNLFEKNRKRKITEEVDRETNARIKVLSSPTCLA
jgi:hypothetical protein